MAQNKPVDMDARATNTLTDDQGNKWQFVEIFNHDLQQYCYALQPVPLKEGETWHE